MYIEKVGISASDRILHIAPEPGIYRKIRSVVANENYIVADFDPDRYGFADSCRKIDLCNLDEWDGDEFDLILHSHVLEHVPCNIAYPLYHLHRMMKPTGVHAFIVPISKGRYDECFQTLGEKERRRRFGQMDHVRRFGRADFDSHLGKLIDVNTDFDAVADHSKGRLEGANIPRHLWQGLHGSTVFVANKGDTIFSRAIIDSCE